jgi:hypothetical protein
MLERNECKDFVKILTAAGVIYNTEVDEQIFSIYWRILKKFSIEKLKDAFSKHFEASQFFPKPADIITIIEGGKDAKALKAWVKVVDKIKSEGAYSSVSFRDKKINATIKKMGGWVKLCAMTTREEAFKAIDFQKIYNLVSDDETLNCPQLLHGILSPYDGSLRQYSPNQPTPTRKTQKVEKLEGFGHLNPLTSSVLRSVCDPRKKVGATA